MSVSLLLPDDAPTRDKMVLHATRRLWQRRGVALSGAEYEAICVGIRAGLYRQVAVGVHDRPIFELQIRGRVIHAVWDRPFDCVVTFLPHRSWVERNHRGQLRRQAQATFTEARA
jgi:hypothetical protein